MNTFQFGRQTNFYKGKVRDVYTIDDKWLVIVASDRISAFDVILPKLIPYKGQVLNQIAGYMLNEVKDICPNWLLSVPAPNISVGRLCKPFKIEMVVRGNLTGHAWRIYAEGQRELCGVRLPEVIRENDFFSSPIITPTTKAEAGHDLDISKEEIIAQKFIGRADYLQMEKYALHLFERGKQIALKQGLILVDTKYEFGKIDDTIYLMDEIHTPDSSRYFYADGFEEKLADNKPQKQLSKEFVREWLIKNHFMGKAGELIPPMNDDWATTISNRYIELYEKLLGQKFLPQSLSIEETQNKIEDVMLQLSNTN